MDLARSEVRSRGSVAMSLVPVVLKRRCCSRMGGLAPSGTVVAETEEVV